MDGLKFKIVFSHHVRLGDIINTTDGPSKVARIDDMSGVLQTLSLNGAPVPPVNITLENDVARLFMPGETVAVARDRWETGDAIPQEIIDDMDRRGIIGNIS